MEESRIILEHAHPRGETARPAKNRAPAQNMADQGASVHV
jgi:hypothetical protein